MSKALSRVIKLPQAEDWADRICTQVGKSVEAILEVGRLLEKAKRELPHGEWGRLFADRLVPFTSRTAQMLMAIAAHPVLSNANQGSHLPPSWRTLYELSQIDRPRLVTALKDGTITPDMPRKAVAALRGQSKRVRPKVDARSKHRTPGVNLYFEIENVLSDKFDALSAEDKSYVLAMLEQRIAELRAMVEKSNA